MTPNLRPRILLLHGIGGGGAIWGDRGSDTVGVLQGAGFEGEAINFPGYGGRDGAPTLGAMMQAVLDACVPEQRTVLLGHSMGGMVAQEVFVRAPHAVQGLVLTCTSASFGKADGDWQARFIAERLAPLDAGLGMAAMADQLVPGLVAPQTSAAARQRARDVMSRVPEATYRVALRAIAAFDRREALAHITVPTLLLSAEHDRTAPPEVMQRMAARITGSDYQCLPSAGHIAHVEVPAAFNAAVLSFLQRHFSG